MKITSFFIAILFSTNFFAQSTFEGIIKQTAVINNQPAEITWYFKKGKLAIESTFTTENGFFILRMIPDVKNQTAKLKTDGTKGKNEYNVTTKEIAAPTTMDLTSLLATPSPEGIKVVTSTTNTYVKIDKDLDIDLSQYTAFFQGNYAILGMIQLGLKGFPVSHSTQANTGKYIESATLKSIEKIAVSDTEFE
jgi:hypothetical protein